MVSSSRTIYLIEISCNLIVCAGHGLEAGEIPTKLTDFQSGLSRRENPFKIIFFSRAQTFNGLLQVEVPDHATLLIGANLFGFFPRADLSVLKTPGYYEAKMVPTN